MKSPVPADAEVEAVLRVAAGAASEFLESLPSRHAGVTATHAELLRGLDVPLSDSGEDPSSVISALVKGAEPGLIASAGPRYFGFVIGGAYPVSVAADWLTSAWDQNAGAYAVSPASSVAEEVAARWLLEILHLPPTAAVGFVTGCQMANYTCLAAARHAVLERAGWDVELRGLQGAPTVNVVLGGEAHVTVYVALRFLGLGIANAIAVEADGQGRIRTDALRDALAPLQGPTIVCLQAGNVNTGAFDPLAEAIEIAHSHGAWVHVDSAFGLWAAASPQRRHLVTGIDAADSWATDAHKWLNVSYDNGLAIVRDPIALHASMGSTAAYLVQSEGAERDPFDWTPEFSRRARGFTVYATLRALGRNGVADLVDRGCRHASMMASLLSEHSGVRILNEVALNQVLVRFHAEGRDDDELTRAVIARVQREGTCWLGGTTWQGMGAMRISFSSWATGDDDVRRSAEAILGCFEGERAARN